jgi:hypothetical protein
MAAVLAAEDTCMSKRLKNNAVAHLCSVMWKQAEGNRVWIVVYSLMAACAVLVRLSAPLVMAKLM